MNREDAEQLAKKIQEDVPGARVCVEPDVKANQYFVDVTSFLRFIVRDEDQWDRRREELTKFQQSAKVKRVVHE